MWNKFRLMKVEGPPDSMATDWSEVLQELLNFVPRFLSFVSSDGLRSAFHCKKM
jgi:hypothetical protein